MSISLWLTTLFFMLRCDCFMVHMLCLLRSLTLMTRSEVAKAVNNWICAGPASDMKDNASNLWSC